MVMSFQDETLTHLFQSDLTPLSYVSGRVKKNEAQLNVIKQGTHSDKIFETKGSVGLKSPYNFLLRTSLLHFLSLKNAKNFKNVFLCCENL
jgi:hypothetical protein